MFVRQREIRQWSNIVLRAERRFAPR